MLKEDRLEGGKEAKNRRRTNLGEKETNKAWWWPPTCWFLYRQRTSYKQQLQARCTED